MGVYEDMANDAGYPYGTDENQQMARNIEEDHMRQMLEDEMWSRIEAENEQADSADGLPRCSCPNQATCRHSDYKGRCLYRR
jgi:hypothetical protein